MGIEGIVEELELELEFNRIICESSLGVVSTHESLSSTQYKRRGMLPRL